MQTITSHRRTILKSFGGLTLYYGLGAAAILTSRKSLAQIPLTPSCGNKTLSQLAGPFFMPGSPERTKLAMPNEKGQIFQLFGEVVDTACKPIPGAILDFWQCDHDGVYDKRGVNFRGHQFASNKGTFALQSLVPGEYVGRTPHLHVKVQRRNGPVLTTQLYFPNQSRNSRDFLFDSRLLVEPRGSNFHFRFVLQA